MSEQAPDKDWKTYLGWRKDWTGRAMPCLVRGIIGVNIDRKYAEELGLKETTPEEWESVTS